MCIRSFVFALGCWALAGCDNSAFFGEPPAEKVEVAPPAMVKPAARPPECQAAMDLIASCKIALEPTRISAVAECKKESYLGDTELQAFLRCLGDGATCEQLVRCSGPIGSMGHATSAGGDK
jgi:hypothetical protein